MTCYFCGSTQCPAIASDDRQDCLHSSDKAIEQERGYIAYLDGESYPADASRDFEDGWIAAAENYGPRP